MGNRRLGTVGAVNTRLVTGKIWDIPFHWSHGMVLVWDEGGVHTIPLKRYGITHGPSSKLSLFRLAYYSNRLSLPLVPHNIPYLLAWDWYGISALDSIPSHGMGADPYIPYHSISFRPLYQIDKVVQTAGSNDSSAVYTCQIDVLNRDESDGIVKVVEIFYKTQ